MPPRTDVTGYHELRLVERFRRGDPDALATLFDMHVDRVFGYALHILGSREDAEEVAGEAFLRAFRRAADFRGDSPFHGWLFGITRNLCRDHLRQPRLLTVPVEVADESAEENAAPSAQVELRSDIRAALADLPEDQREALVLCDVEQWDAPEAAEMLDRSVAATKSLLYRARRALRSRLAERWAVNEGKG